MNSSKYAAVVLLLLFTVSVTSYEAHEEWSARQRVEAKSRAMFSGHPMVDNSAPKDPIHLSKNRV